MAIFDIIIPEFLFPLFPFSFSFFVYMKISSRKREVRGRYKIEILVHKFKYITILTIHNVQ
jgi:hypothetical protein